MYGQRVDYHTSSIVDEERRSPTDYIVTCAKNEAEAIEFEQEEEVRRTSIRSIAKGMMKDMMTTPREICTKRGGCWFDEDCCIGKLCQVNPDYIFIPDYEFWFLDWFTCQDDPAYRFRDEGEVREHIFRPLLYLLHKLILFYLTLSIQGCNIFGGLEMSCDPGLYCKGTRGKGYYNEGVCVKANGE